MPSGACQEEAQTQLGRRINTINQHHDLVAHERVNVRDIADRTNGPMPAVPLTTATPEGKVTGSPSELMQMDQALARLDAEIHALAAEIARLKDL